MATLFSLDQILGYVPLTDMVTRVTDGVPQIVPDGFFNITREVMGDRFRRQTFRQTRKLSKISRYGAPPRQVARVGRGQQDVVMLTVSESMDADYELLKLFRKFDTYEVQMMAQDIIRQDAIEFGRRMNNLERAAVQASLAYGKLWFNAEGELLLSSSGADVEIDYGIPAGNVGNVGGLISASWATTSTDIPTQVNNIKTMVRQKTGTELKYAFYTKNVAGYLARNTSFQQYLARNPQYQQSYINSGQIAPGTLDLTWIPVQDAFFEDESGAIQEVFPVDQVTFYPEITAENYTMAKGGILVPKKFITAEDLQTALAQAEYVYGMYKYAWAVPGSFQIKMAQGHTFLPDHKKPESIVIADVTQ